MRTTVNVQDDVAKDLFAYAPGRTKTAAINHALAEWVRLQRIRELRSLRGKLDIADDLADLRAMDKGTD